MTWTEGGAQRMAGVAEPMEILCPLCCGLVRITVSAELSWDGGTLWLVPHTDHACPPPRSGLPLAV